MVPVHAVPKPAEDQPIVMPRDPICYCVGKDGVYKRIKNACYDALVKVEGIKHLAALEEGARIFAVPMPEEILRHIECFFQAVYDEHKAEAIVLLFYNPESKQWAFQVPKQEVSAAEAKYTFAEVEAPEGFDMQHLFGTAHSHAAMNAFFSGTDDKDDIYVRGNKDGSCDGLHLVIGNFDKPSHSYAARWILAGAPFKAELDQVVEGVKLPKVNPTWMALVQKKTYQSQYQSNYGAQHGVARTQQVSSPHTPYRAGASKNGSPVSAPSSPSTTGTGGKEKEKAQSTTPDNGKPPGRVPSDAKGESASKADADAAKVADELIEHWEEQLGEDAILDLEEGQTVAQALKSGSLSEEEAELVMDELSGFRVTQFGVRE